MYVDFRKTRLEIFLYPFHAMMKIAAVVVGLFVAALAYLSYKGLIDVKWIAMENATRSALTIASGQVVHAVSTATSINMTFDGLFVFHMFFDRIFHTVVFLVPTKYPLK